MEEIFNLKTCKDDEEWLISRSIGGTSASVILDANPYKTKLDLYNELVSKQEHIFTNTNDETNEVLKRGHDLEPIIRSGFMLDYQKSFKVIEPPKHNWVYSRKDKPYLTASLDGKIEVIKDFNEKIKDGMVGILEIKTRDCRNKKEEEEWLSCKLPQHYYIQCLHYLLVSGFDFVILRSRICTYDYFNEYGKQLLKIITKDFFIYRDEVTKELELLEKKETDFWENNILKKQKPSIILNLNF